MATVSRLDVGSALRRLGYDARVRTVPRLRAALVHAMQETAIRGEGVVADSIERTRPHPPVDTGDMKRSIAVDMTATGAVLRVTAPHAVFMELGTRPHRPPLAPLADWAMNKGLASDEAEAMQIARGIANKIAQHGLAPRHYFARACQRIRAEVLPREIDAAMRAAGAKRRG